MAGPTPDWSHAPQVLALPSGPAQDSLKPTRELDTSEMRQFYVFLVSLAFSGNFTLIHSLDSFGPLRYHKGFQISGRNSEARISSQGRHTESGGRVWRAHI